MMKMRCRILPVVCFLAVVFAGCSKSAGENEVLVYSIINQQEMEALGNLFTEQTGIRVQFLCASTGELVNRVIAEKAQPQADVLLGGPSSFHIEAAANGALDEYRSPVAENFPAFTKAADGTWHGICALALGIGVNTDVFSKKFAAGTAIPATWDDLLNPVFDGELVVTDPASSSTAYLFVQNQLQRLGWINGWDYLTKLSQLVGQFPSSGGAPPKLVGTGEYAIGVAYVHALAKYKSQGFPVQIIVPPQSAGDIDAVSILKNCPNKKNAREFVDFILSVPAQELFASMSFTIPVNPDVRPADGSVDISAIDLIKYDSDLAGKQRDDVLKRWQMLVK